MATLRLALSYRSAAPRLARDPPHTLAGSLLTRRWRKGDSNPRSLSRPCRLMIAEEKGLQVDPARAGPAA